MLEEIAQRFPDERERYEYSLWLFFQKIPPDLRRHRAYFSVDRRAFGEDAFTAMWWVIFNECKPESALEIGVYRGQVLSLWGVLAALSGIQCEAWGISPLDSSGDEVSRYRSAIDYELDVTQHFEHFGLGEPNLMKAYSQDPEARSFVNSRAWDLIYVDGSHDLDDVVADLDLCTGALRTRGVLVVDDASLFSDYRPPRFSFKGHPGPSTAIRIAPGMSRMIEIGSCGHNRIFRKIA